MEPDSFHMILVALAPVFSQPSFQSFAFLLEGWLLAGMRAMTSTALAAQGNLPKHYASYYRFFSQGAWRADALGAALVRLVLPFAPAGWLVAVVDDTIARKSGKHIWGANVHHDPLGYVPNALCFGHNWVVLALVIRVPLVQRDVAVPVFWRLYRSRKARKGKSRQGKPERKTTGAASQKEYRTRPQLAVEMLQELRRVLGDERPLCVVGDSAYGGKSITRHLPHGTVCISRMPMNAALYQPPPPKTGKRGCPRKKGARLPSPAQMAADATPWRKATVRLYGKDVTVRYKTCTALWYNSAGSALLRIVVVRDPKGRRKDDAFYSTDPTMSVETILRIYAQRWSLEVAFRDTKQHLGFEHSQARTRKAVERTGPFAFVAYTITVVWFCRCGHRTYPVFPIMPWYRHKRTPSFLDMHAMLRAELLSPRCRAVAAGQHEFSHTPVNVHPLQKPTKANPHAHERAA